MNTWGHGQTRGTDGTTTCSGPRASRWCIAHGNGTTSANRRACASPTTSSYIGCLRHWPPPVHRCPLLTYFGSCVFPMSTSAGGPGGGEAAGRGRSAHAVLHVLRAYVHVARAAQWCTYKSAALPVHCIVGCWLHGALACHSVFVDCIQFTSCRLEGPPPGRLALVPCRSGGQCRPPIGNAVFAVFIRYAAMLRRSLPHHVSSCSSVSVNK